MLCRDREQREPIPCRPALYGSRRDAQGQPSLRLGVGRVQFAALVRHGCQHSMPGYCSLPRLHDALRDSFLCLRIRESQFHGTDWRPPEIFSYDLRSKILTPKSSEAPLLNGTIGIRSAGSLGNVVILAGPALPPQVGIN